MNIAVEDRDYHTFRFTEADIETYFPEKVLRDVIATEAFKRLKSIHFLGSIDYLVDPSQNSVEERHTRFDHSLGVASLARRFALHRGLEPDDLLNVVVAALLHDIGHAPLSHSLEPAFKSIFEINHHVVGEKILRGEVPLGTKLAFVLGNARINNFEVMALIAGHGSGLAKEPFARAINVDTIEGIIRSASYRQRREIIMSPVMVMDAFTRLGKASHDVLDEFWNLKNRVYSTVIQSPTGLIADYLCKRYMEINVSGFRSSYYYGTERELIRDHASLFEALELLGRSGKVEPGLIRDGDEITFTRRSFYIDKTVVLRSYADIDRRYLQRKVKKEFLIKKWGGEGAHTISEHPTIQRLL